MFELKDFSAFKHHLRDFLVQTKQFASQDNADLFAEEVAQQREVRECRLAVWYSDNSVHRRNDSVCLPFLGCCIQMSFRKRWWTRRHGFSSCVLFPSAGISLSVC